MDAILPFNSPIARSLVVFGILLIRYFVLAMGAYMVFFVLMKNRFASRRIHSKPPRPEVIRLEILSSIGSLFILALISAFITVLNSNGWTRIYMEINQLGIPYFIFSIILLLLLHDMYFYFGHRLMHTRLLYRRTHAFHHRFHQPTPFASFAFQPTEAIIQGLFGFLVVFLIPVHPGAFILFVFLMNIMNVIGHLGHEIFPVGFSRGTGGWIMNTPTHHAMHHSHVHCNYGLYFNWWDRLFGTNHPDYHETFDRFAVPVKSRLTLSTDEGSDRFT